jgi:hypothetical protein
MVWTCGYSWVDKKYMQNLVGKHLRKHPLKKTEKEMRG